jgi:hypothetical protein
LASDVRTCAASLAARASATAVVRRGQAPAALVAVVLGRGQGQLDLRQADGRRPALLLGLGALGGEHGLLPLEARHLLLRGEKVVPQGDEVLLRDVDAVFQAADLGHRRLRPCRRLLSALARAAQGGLDLLLAGRDLADLASRGEQSLDPAPAFHHRPAQGLAGEGHAGHRPLARHDLERVFQRVHDQRLRKRRLDGRGVGSRHAEHVAEEASRLGLLGGHVAQGHAVRLGARGRQGQERAAPGPGLLEVADPAQRPPPRPR